MQIKIQIACFSLTSIRKMQASEDGEVTITRCSEAGWALQSTGRQEQTPVLDSGPLPCFTPSRESQTLPGPAGTTRGSGWEGKLCGPGEESGRTAWAISLRLLAKVFLFSPGLQVVTLDKGLGSLGPGQSLHWGKDRALQEQQGQSLSCLLLYPGTACCYATAKGSSGQILVATTGKAPRAT